MSDVKVNFKGDHSSVDNSVSKVKGGIAGISVAAKGLGTSLKAAFAPLILVGAALGGIAAITNGIKGVIDAGGDLDDLSAKTGEAAGELLVLQNAFELAGVSADSVSKAVIGLNNKLEAPTPKIISTLNDLGVSLDDLQNMSMAEKFDRISSAIGGIDDVNKRAAVSSTLFGRNLGQALLPLFVNKGAIAESQRAIGGLADTMTKNAAVFAKLGDAFDLVGIKSKQFFGAALGENADRLEDVADRFIGADFTEAGKAFGQSIKNTLDGIEKALGGQSLGAALKVAFESSEETITSVLTKAIRGAFSGLFAREGPIGQISLGKGAGGEATVGKTMEDVGFLFRSLGQGLSKGIFGSLQRAAEGTLSDFYQEPAKNLLTPLGFSTFAENLKENVGSEEGWVASSAMFAGQKFSATGLPMFGPLLPAFKIIEDTIRSMPDVVKEMIAEDEAAAAYSRLAAKQKVVTDGWFAMMEDTSTYLKQMMPTIEAAKQKKQQDDLRFWSDWLGLTVTGVAKARIMKPEPFKELGGAIPLSDLQRVGGAKIFSTAGSNAMLEEQKKANATLIKIYEESKRRNNVPLNLMSVFA
jgi:hypothetical protein